MSTEASRAPKEEIQIHTDLSDGQGLSGYNMWYGLRKWYIFQVQYQVRNPTIENVEALCTLTLHGNLVLDTDVPSILNGNNQELIQIFQVDFFY